MQIQEVNKAALQDTKAASESMEASIERGNSVSEAPVQASETQQMSNQDKLKAYKSFNRVSSMQVSNNGDVAAFSQTGLAMSHTGSGSRSQLTTTTALDGEKKELPKLNKLNVPIPE